MFIIDEILFSLSYLNYACGTNIYLPKFQIIDRYLLIIQYVFIYF